MNAQTIFIPQPPQVAASAYETLRKVNVNDKIEKKNGLSYLSWPFAVDTLLSHDPDASWTYPESKVYGETLMVFCAVTAFGRLRTAQLPVMDHRNKAIANPDAFAVNTAMQRCLVKAIALHGLGLYVYAGEDVPAEADNTVNPRGDLGTAQPKKIYMEWADKMRAILEADVEEDVKALHVADLHDSLRIQHDVYVGASDCLSSKERSAWKAYVSAAKKIQDAEPIRR